MSNKAYSASTVYPGEIRIDDPLVLRFFKDNASTLGLLTRGRVEATTIKQGIELYWIDAKPYTRIFIDAWITE